MHLLAPFLRLTTCPSFHWTFILHKVYPLSAVRQQMKKEDWLTELAACENWPEFPIGPSPIMEWAGMSTNLEDWLSQTLGGKKEETLGDPPPGGREDYSLKPVGISLLVPSFCSHTIQRWLYNKCHILIRWSIHPVPFSVVPPLPSPWARQPGLWPSSFISARTAGKQRGAERLADFPSVCISVAAHLDIAPCLGLSASSSTDV